MKSYKITWFTKSNFKIIHLTLSPLRLTNWVCFVWVQRTGTRWSAHLFLVSSLSPTNTPVYRQLIKPPSMWTCSWYLKSAYSDTRSLIGLACGFSAFTCMPTGLSTDPQFSLDLLPASFLLVCDIKHFLNCLWPSWHLGPSALLTVKLRLSSSCYYCCIMSKPGCSFAGIGPATV